MAKYLDAYDYDSIREQAGYVIKNRKKMKKSAGTTLAKDDRIIIQKKDTAVGNKIIFGYINNK